MSIVLKSRNGGGEERLTLVKLSPVSKVTGLFFNFPVTLQGEGGGGEAGPGCSQRYRSFRGCRQEMESPRAGRAGMKRPRLVPCWWGRAGFGGEGEKPPWEQGDLRALK